MEEPTETRKERRPNTEIGAEEAKRSFGELVARSGFGGERFVITRFGKAIAALVSTSDLEKLEALEAVAAERAVA
jgi:prevent-host-death family protein